MQVTKRSDQSQLNKRDSNHLLFWYESVFLRILVYLLDQSAVEVTFTLWAEVASNFDGEPGTAIGIKGAVVREFMGMFTMLLLQVVNNGIIIKFRRHFPFNYKQYDISFESIRRRYQKVIFLVFNRKAHIRYQSTKCNIKRCIVTRYFAILFKNSEIIGIFQTCV